MSLTNGILWGAVDGMFALVMCSDIRLGSRDLFLGLASLVLL